ncbi:MAG: pyrroline-5-carboxylate reductase [Acidobacteria bacterium]|nr:pyrroline-5-carboxylate reductase [Acidobacteriota bacterium]
MGLKIAILGAGNIGGALLGGILKSHLAEPKDVVATDAREERRRELEEQWKVCMLPTSDNRKAVAGRDVVILAVKPNIVQSVLEEIRNALQQNQIVLSVAAAVPLSFIESVLGKRVPLFRAMPNIPVLVEEGATAVAGNLATTPEQRKVIEKIFGSLGVVVFVEEGQLDAVTALSGSGPAYIYMVIEALIEGGKKMGLSHEVATRLTEQTVLGAAKLVRETKLHPAILRDEVTTPGGTTIAAIHELEKHGLRAMLISAVETATARSKEIAASIVEKYSASAAPASKATAPAKTAAKNHTNNRLKKRKGSR